MIKNILSWCCAIILAFGLAQTSSAEKVVKEISMAEVSEAAGFFAASEEHTIKKVIDVEQFKRGFSDANKMPPDMKRIKQAEQLIAKTWGFSNDEKKREPTTGLAKPSYELGVMRAVQTKETLKKFDAPLYLSSFEKSFPLKVDYQKFAVANQTIALFVKQERLRGAEERLKAAQEFLSANALRKNVIVAKSGLQYEVLAEGSGNFVAPVDAVTVHYKLLKQNGAVVYDSEKDNAPVQFALRGDIPEGWRELFLLMKQGAHFKSYAAPALGYGLEGSGDHVLPNEVLITEFKLLEITPPPPVVF